MFIWYFLSLKNSSLRFYVVFIDTKLSITWTAPGTAFDTKFSIHSNVWWYGVMLYRVITFGHVAYPGKFCINHVYSIVNNKFQAT